MVCHCVLWFSFKSTLKLLDILQLFEELGQSFLTYLQLQKPHFGFLLFGKTFQYVTICEKHEMLAEAWNPLISQISCPPNIFPINMKLHHTFCFFSLLHPPPLPPKHLQQGNGKQKLIKLPSPAYTLFWLQSLIGIFS